MEPPCPIPHPPSTAHYDPSPLIEASPTTPLRAVERRKELFFPLFPFFLYPHIMPLAPVTVAWVPMTGAVAPLWRQSLPPRRQRNSCTDAQAPVCSHPISITPRGSSVKRPPCPSSSSVVRGQSSSGLCLPSFVCPRPCSGHRNQQKSMVHINHSTRKTVQ